jgi:signal transduction histidine kinase
MAGRAARFRTWLFHVGALTGAYLAGAIVGLGFLFEPWTSTLWPPSGVSLAGILLGGYRLWPAVTIGSFTANAAAGLQRDVPAALVLGAAAAMAVANTVQALLGAWLIRLATGREGPLHRAQNVLSFVLLGPILSTVVSATVGTLALCSSTLVAWERWQALWTNWWLGNMMGDLIFTPLILTWWTLRADWPRGREAAEAVLLFVSLLLVSRLVFGSVLATDISRYPLVYLPMPLVGWAALRFGMHGAVTANAVLTGVAVYSTVRQSGPFVEGTMVESLFLLQTFDGVSAVTGLVLAAIVSERTRGEEALREARDSLEERVVERTAELRALSERLESVREEERTRIAREIHDELGQSLTALKIDLSWLAKRLPAAKRELHQRASGMARSIDATLGSMRRLASELRPKVLDELGLLDALEWQLQEFEARTDIRCFHRFQVGDVALDAARSTDVFRVLQEALTNVARHAAATRVDLTVIHEDGRLVLELRDDGCGIRDGAGHDRRSTGLVGMRERVTRWRGSLEIRTGVGEGTTVRVELPVDEAPAERLARRS